MSLRGLRQRERSGGVQLEAPVAQQGEAPLGALARLVGKASRQGRQREGAYLLRLRREHGEVDRIGRAASATVQDEVPERGETAKPFLDGGLTDGVEDEIDAPIAGESQHFVRKLGLHVVDGRGGAALLPPAAEWTSTLLPGPVESTVCRRWYAVSTWIRSAAPSTKLTESGSGMTMNEGDTQYSAYARPGKGGRGVPMNEGDTQYPASARLVKAATRIPGCTFVTPSPPASTTPAASIPGM